MRIDKWLWAARFFKTRALASRACELGRIESNRTTAKASRELKIGDRLRIQNEAGEFRIDVLALSEMRGPAAKAQELYSETEQSREQRQQKAAERKALVEMGAFPPFKPSTRDRRLLNRMRGR